MEKGLDNSSGLGKGKDKILEKNGGKDKMSEDYRDGNCQPACQDNNREDENNDQQESIKIVGETDENIRSRSRMSDTEKDREQFYEETGKVENDTQQENKRNDTIEEIKKIVENKLEALDSRLEKIESNQEEKLEALNSRLEKIESNQEDRLEALNSRLGDIESKQEEKLETLNSRLGDIESKQEEKLETLNSRLGDIESKFKTQKEYEEKLKKKEVELHSKELELKGVRDNLKSKESELAETKSNLETKEKKLDNTKEQLQLKESELATTSSNLETTKIRLNESETKLNTIENYLFKFKPLVRKMEKCSSLSKINSQINSESENKKLLKFVGIFGNGEDFLRDLYKEFKDNKMNEKIALTTEELEFIDEINHYFRENILEEGQEEDVLITVDPNQDKFDKSIMQDILKASDFSFKTVEEFYVPGVKTKSYNMKAIVRGRK